jgi:stress response protein SCP2
MGNVSAFARHQAGRLSMVTVSGPLKGTTSPLPVPAGGAGRFLVGLSWVPKSEGPKIHTGIPPLKDDQGHYDTFYFFKLPYFVLRAAVLGVAAIIAPVIHRHGIGMSKETRPKNSDPHDLDLFCYILDHDMQVLQLVGPKDAALIEPGKKIYHSGENQTGRDATDAEQIYLETRGLPPEYHYFFFAVKSANRNQMGDIPDGNVRLADSAANVNLLQNLMTARAAPPGNSFGYVFCSIFRDGDGWSFRNIDSFVGKEVDWHLLLQALDLQKRLA